MVVRDEIMFEPGADGPHLLVGQCKRCRRYICADHAEGIRPAGKRVADTKVRLACCPFDPGVRLGSG
jgi:hypothetical protein